MSSLSDDILQKSVENLYGAGTPMEDLSPEELAAAVKDAKKRLKANPGPANVAKVSADIDAYAERLQNPRTPENKAKVTADAAKARENDILKEVTTNAQTSKVDNREFVDSRVTPQLDRALGAGDTADTMDREALELQKQARDKANKTRADSLAEARGNTTNYNQQKTDEANYYTGQQDALNAQDQAGLSRYMGETDPLMQMYTAQGSDPADVARQQASYSQLAGAGNGSLDYQAQTYTSNAGDVARESSAYNTLAATGGGALDYRSQAAQAYADPMDVANERKGLLDVQNDLNNGDKDQREIYDLEKSRTGVTATAEEALLAEVARRKFESADKSNRDAVQEELGQRGIRSGAAEIAGTLGARDQLSQDRSMAELGLQANAMQRARDYTQLAGSEANTMRGDKQNALDLQGRLASNLRNEGFDEEYKRGVGADNASANNQATRLGGQQSAGTLASQIRSQSDAVGTFNVGQVNNAQANNQTTRMQGMTGAANQSNAIRSANDSMRMFQDNYKSQEASRVGELATSRVNAGLNTTAQSGVRNDSTHTAKSDAIDANRIASDKVTDDMAKYGGEDYITDSDVGKMTGDVGQRAVDRRIGLVGSGTNVASTRATIGSADDDRVIEALKLESGTNSKNRGLDELGAY